MGKDRDNIRYSLPARITDIAEHPDGRGFIAYISSDGEDNGKEVRVRNDWDFYSEGTRCGVTFYKRNGI